MIKKNKFLFYIFIFSLSLFFLSACEGKKNNRVQGLIGNWECRITMDSYGPEEENKKTIYATHHIHFGENNEGLWETRFSNETSESHRTFTYKISDDKVTLLFEDGSKEEFTVKISENANELNLKNKKSDYRLKKK